MDCRNCRELIHEWLEELLATSEAEAMAAHVADCPACQKEKAKAGSLRSKVRAALLIPFPEVEFKAPAPFEIPQAPLPTKPKASGWRIEKTLFAIAASLLVLMCGGIVSNFLVDQKIQTLQELISQAAVRVEQARGNIIHDRGFGTRLASEYAQEVARIREEINSQPIRLVVNGPAGIIGGAPTQYVAQAITPNGQNLKIRLEASLEDPRTKGKEILLDVASQTDGTYRISLPPDAPILPGEDPILRVRALPQEKPVDGTKPLPLAEVTERIKLGLPPLTTHLTTDKRLYQPGETVYFRSLTLERATLKPPAGPLRLRVRLINPNKSERQILVSDGLMALADSPGRPLIGPSGKPLRGIVAGEIPLEGDQPGGEYTLKIEDADGRFVPAERKFLVQVYQKPRLNKELVFSKRGFGPGEPVEFTVTGSGADGKPLAGQRVEGRLTLDGKNLTVNGSLAPNPNQTVSLNLDSNGKANFRFQLPPTAQIQKGDCSVTVVFTDGGNVETLVKPVPLVLDRVDVNLFPEGGDLVAGLPGKVYFTARTRLNKPTDITARLLENGKPIGPEIHSLHTQENPGANQGLGAFEFTPKSGANYALELVTPSKGTRVPLPAIRDQGVILNTDGTSLIAGGKVPVRLRTSEDGTWFVGLYCRGRLLDSKLVVGKDNQVELSPAAELGGVCRLTVFRVDAGGTTQSGKKGQGSLTPVAERLLWRPVADNLRVDMKVQKIGDNTGAPPAADTNPVFAPGEKVRLKVTLRDGKGNPTAGILLASVVDQSVVTLADEKTARSMPTHFLLGEEVLHPEDLEFADFLLTPHPLAKQAIDLLLGTQGWRRFAEQDPAKFQQQYPLEAPDFLISAGLGRQKSTLSTESSLETRIRSLAPKYDDRARQQKAISEKNLEESLVASSKVQELERIANSYRAKLTPSFPYWAGSLAFLTSVGGALTWLCRGKTIPAKLGISLGIPLGLVLCFGLLLLLSRDYWPSKSIRLVAPLAYYSSEGRSYPPKSAAPKMDGFQVLSGDAGNEGWANRGLPVPLGMDKPTSSELRKKSNALVKQSGTGPNSPAPANRPTSDFQPRAGFTPPARPRSALLGNTTTTSPMGEFLNGVDRLALPEVLANSDQLLRTIGGEDLPPVPMVREFAHTRVFGSSEKTRADFTETLLWKPVWILSSGEGFAEFELPDSVTRFAARVEANTEDGRLASGSTLFESKLPLSLSLKVPGQTTANDTLEPPLTIEGPAGVGVKWQVKKLTGATLEGPSQGEMVLNGSGRGRALIRFRPEKEASVIQYELACEAGEWRDTVSGSIQVATDGFPVSGSLALHLEGRKEMNLRLPEDWQKGSLNLRVEGYPSVLGEILTGLDGMLREPHGCFEQTSSTSYPNLMVLRFLKTAGVASPEVEARARDLLAKGYQRLVGFECPDTKAGIRQGFEWFGAADQQHEGLTAYGLLQFTGMREIGLAGMDPQLIPRTRGFLLSKRDGRGGFLKTNRRLDSFGNSAGNLTDAYIIWALAMSGDTSDLKPEMEALAKRADSITDPYEMALVANALLLAGKTTEGKNLNRKLAGMQNPEGAVPGAKTSITHSSGDGLLIETTSMAILAWLQEKDPALLPNCLKGIQWLAGKRGAGTFGSTQATVLALEAMMKFQEQQAQKSSDGTLSFSARGKAALNLGFPKGAINKVSSDLGELESGLKPGDNPVALELSKGNAFPVSMNWQYFTLTPPTSPKATIQIDANLDRPKAMEGESVRLTVKVRNQTKTDTGMVMAIVGLPAGLIVPPDAKQLNEITRIPGDGSQPLVAAWEQRGRELALYWRGLGEGKEVEVSIDLIAQVPGNYIGPASRSYLYYSPEIKFWQKGLAIQVLPRP